MIVKYLTALISSLTVLIGLSEAPKQRSKQKRGADAVKALTPHPSNGTALLTQLGLPPTFFLPMDTVFTKWIFSNEASERTSVKEDETPLPPRSKGFSLLYDLLQRSDAFDNGAPSQIAVCYYPITSNN